MEGRHMASVLDRRRRERYRLERELAAKQISARQAKFERYFTSIDEAEPGDALMLVVRVSRPAQARNGNLAAAAIRLCREAKVRGLRVVGIALYVANGADFHLLRRIARRAKKLGASLLAESHCRFIRSTKFHPKTAPYVEPTRRELKALRRMTLGLHLYTVTAPDASHFERTSSQTKRGQRKKASQSTNGRGPQPKRQRRDRLGPIAWLLRNEHGMSLDQISKDLKVAKTTVKRWAESEHVRRRAVLVGNEPCEPSGKLGDHT